jgi:type I restriction enzyme, S subunit
MVDNGEIPIDFKKTEISTIPDDWIIYTIEELTPKSKKYGIVDGPFGSNLKTIHYRKSGIPIITSGYVTNGKFYASDYLYVDKEKFKQEKRSTVRGGDIVMAKIGANCGASAILPIEHPEGILSGNALKITIDESRFSTKIISQILWRNYSIGKFEELRTTGAQPAISMANLKKFKLPLPALKAEQTAIATALSDTDVLIENFEKLIVKKRNIKQGVMQELLTAKKRLAGYNSEWEVRKLGEITEVVMGQSPKSEFYNTSGLGLPLIQGNADVENRKTIIRTYTSNITKKGKKGATIMSVRAPVGEISKATFNCCLGRGVCAISYKNDYIYHYLIYFEKSWTSVSTGSTFDSVNSAQVNNLEIPIPVCEEEQTTIAIVFNDMDTEIEALEQKLHKYRMIKQGMMQVLLTGKIRLI